MGLIRLIVFGFLALSVLYVVISIYVRSLYREHLENEWAEQHPDSTDTAARDAFVDAAMQEYRRTLWPKLVLLVYVIPTLFVIGTLIAINWN